MKRIICAILSLSVLFTSCSSKVSFTTKSLTDYKLTNEDVQKLQFYLQGDIVLTNGNSEKGTKTEGGELVIKDEQSINKVVISSGTKGVVEKIEEGLMYVSFEVGRNLLFRASPTDGKYRLKTEKFDPRKRIGTLNYGQEEFYVASNSLQSHLVFKLKNSVKRKSNQRSVKGRKL